MNTGEWCNKMAVICVTGGKAVTPHTPLMDLDAYFNHCPGQCSSRSGCCGVYVGPESGRGETGRPWMSAWVEQDGRYSLARLRGFRRPALGNVSLRANGSIERAVWHLVFHFRGPGPGKDGMQRWEADQDGHHPPSLGQSRDLSPRPCGRTPLRSGLSLSHGWISAESPGALSSQQGEVTGTQYQL